SLRPCDQGTELVGFRPGTRQVTCQECPGGAHWNKASALRKAARVLATCSGSSKGPIRAAHGHQSEPVQIAAYYVEWRIRPDPSTTTVYPLKSRRPRTQLLESGTYEIWDVHVTNNSYIRRPLSPRPRWPAVLNLLLLR